MCDDAYSVFCDEDGCDAVITCRAFTGCERHAPEEYA